MSERDDIAKIIESIDAAAEWDASPAMYAMYADAILAAGYVKPRVVTTMDELVTFPQGAKFYSTKTTHSWVLNDLTKFRGVLVHGTGGGYTYLKDFIEYEAPLTVLHEGITP